MSVPTTSVRAELRKLSRGYLQLLALSAVNPVLYLAGPIYTHQIHERVALSRNEATLWILSAIALFVLAGLTILQSIREQALRRLGVDFDKRMTAVVFNAIHREPVGSVAASQVPLGDVTTVRDFISGYFVGAALDLVWSPLILVVMFLIHPLMGALSIAMIGLSAISAFALSRLTWASTEEQRKYTAEEQIIGNAIWRNAESVRALGMLGRLRDLWYARHSAGIGWQDQGIARGRPFVVLSRFLRSAQMVFVFGLGCLLYLNGQASLGILMFAGIIMMRLVAPVDYIINNWSQVGKFQAARDRLDALLEKQSTDHHRIALPRPNGALVVTRVIATPPNSERVALNDVSFSIAPGRVVGVLGSSGAGKSTLSRLLVGVWRPKHGSIAIGDHDLSHWDSDDLGRHLGYVPQDIELLPGTLAQNISRFDPDSETSPDRLLEAVRSAGLTDLVRGLPKGLNTEVGSGGFVPSGGQRQRLALARALYGDPYLVVMDEPNSNLDATGESALAAAVNRLRMAGSIIVVVTHKMNMLSFCDDLLVLNNGVVQAFGPRAQILDRLPKQRPGAVASVVEVPRISHGGSNDS